MAWVWIYVFLSCVGSEEQIDLFDFGSEEPIPELFLGLKNKHCTRFVVFCSLQGVPNVLIFGFLQEVKLQYAIRGFRCVRLHAFE